MDTGKSIALKGGKFGDSYKLVEYGILLVEFIEKSGVKRDSEEGDLGFRHRDRYAVVGVKSCTKYHLVTDVLRRHLWESANQHLSESGAKVLGSYLIL